MSWETAFWTLVPLAIGAMTQPSGRVLGTPNRYRTYLRSSPIICALDAVFFIIRILINPLYFHISLRQSIVWTVANRYRGNEDASEGIQSLERLTWLRWLWFLLGTLGPAVKLAAMRGVPWTKAWGMMFLSAWVVFEIVGFMGKRAIDAAKRMQADPAEIENLLAEAEDVNEDFNFLTKDKFGNIVYPERLVFVFAVLLHVLLFLWAIVNLWGMRAYVYADPDIIDRGRFPELVPLNSAVQALAFFLVVPSVTCVILYAFTKSLMRGWVDRPLYILIPISLMWLFLIAVLLGYICFCFWVGSKVTHASTFYIDIPILFTVVGGAPLVGFLVNVLSSSYPRLGSQLLVRFPSGDLASGNTKSDQGAVWSLVLFLINLTVSVLWYAFRFDSEGTVNPSWTGVFG